jgi:catechol 2,3-dioxygenase-like lactoylglutathione lyase family enzyme
MRQQVSLITLGVREIGRARRFYEALGWQAANDDPNVVFFQMQGAVLALWGRGALAGDAGVASQGNGFRAIALAHNVGSKADVDAVLEEVKAAGGRIVKAAGDTFWGGYSGYFTDPDDHLWEVAHNPFWRLDAEGRVRLK